MKTHATKCATRMQLDVELRVARPLGRNMQLRHGKAIT